MAAFASHHVWLALFPFRLDTDRTGYRGRRILEDTTATPEARQQASREYKERHDKMKKAAEAVIDAEPIPLGHRQMVKRYFESIRPSNGDAADKPAAPPEKK